MTRPCLYCGNNQVPHRLFWYNESLNIFLTPFRQKLLYNPLSRFVAKRGLGQSAALFFLMLGEVLKIITRQNERSLCKVSRAQVLWEEAEKRGIKMSELLLFGKAFDTYVAEKNSRMQNEEFRMKVVFSGLPRPRTYYNNRLDLMDDKAWFKKIMLAHNLPVAAGGSCTSFRQARAIFNRLQATSYKLPPVIVKPRSGSRGRHSTTFVNSEADLKKAFSVAQQLCHWVIVEEQLFGPVYRATVINFELGGVLRGDSPQVVGDGISSIGQLISQKNSASHPGVKDIKSDEQTQIFLLRQGLELSSVPEKGQAVNLSEKIGVNYGGSSAEELEICHPDNKELFVRAAKVFGDPIVGFDFIIPDITKSWKEQKCGFLEANTLPFINLHHDPLHGRPRNVAAMVWAMVGW